MALKVTWVTTMVAVLARVAERLLTVELTGDRRAPIGMTARPSGGRDRSALSLCHVYSRSRFSYRMRAGV